MAYSEDGDSDTESGRDRSDARRLLKEIAAEKEELESGKGGKPEDKSHKEVKKSKPRAKAITKVPDDAPDGFEYETVKIIEKCISHITEHIVELDHKRSEQTTKKDEKFSDEINEALRWYRGFEKENVRIYD